MNRIRHWDLAKGIAIILVILGHATELSDKGSDHFLHSFIYSFHMPLFMIISGYFFAHSLTHRSTKDIVIRKTIQLVCPIFIIATIEFFATKFNPSCSLHDNLYSFYAILIRTLWFLQALFFSSMLVLFGERFITHHIVFYAILLVVFVLTPDFFKSAGTKFLFPCFLFGLHIYRFKWDFQALLSPLKVFLVSLALFAFLFIPFDHSKTIYVHSVYIFSGNASPICLLIDDFYRVIIGIVGSIAIISLIMCIEKAFEGKQLRIGSSIARIGTHTLGLYIAHIYLFIYFVRPHFKSFVSLETSSLMIVTLGFLFLFAVSYPFAILIEKTLDSALNLYAHYGKTSV